jgi:hypothetical protein
VFETEIAETNLWFANMESCLHFSRGGDDRRAAEITWVRAKLAELEMLEIEYADAWSGSRRN